MMKTTAYQYESDWRRYAFPPQTCGFAPKSKLEKQYSRVDLVPGGKLEAGGLPIDCDGQQAVINAGDDHTLIFGGTASKKTRTLIAPLIQILAQAGESMIIMDVKGELSDGKTFPGIRGELEDKGYDCHFVNLREMNGDGVNLLLEPYRLYRNGERDEALVMINNIVDALAAIYKGSKADPYWELTAKLYLTATMVLMFELCDDPERINMLSLSNYTTETGCSHMGHVADYLAHENNIMNMLRSVTSEPEKTRACTLTTVNSMLTNFLTNDNLLRMLSTSTFDFHSIGKKPTALFIILPDEVDTYAGIAGLLLQQLSATLVRDAYLEGGKLPVRVNFLCDEFCNYFVPGMMRSISAHRSRNIRWYMVCQSRKQLQTCYEKEADTIIANCTNIFFLNSPELDLMKYLSERTGMTTVTQSGSPEPILKVADLQNLKKTWTHTDVYFTSGNVHYVTALPDVSQYNIARSYTTVIPRPIHRYPEVKVFTAAEMKERAQNLRECHNRRRLGRTLNETETKLADKYRKLFT